MQKLIYLKSLQAFEASARHGSFAKAAEELHITPAAVGQLVHSLEKYLGVLLFKRKQYGKNRLILTQAAQYSLEDIQIGFRKLSNGLDKMQSYITHSTLMITASPAVTSKWFLAKLKFFQTLYPNIDIKMHITADVVDFVRENIDIGIRYGLGYWHGLIAEKLMEEDLYPVCTAKFLSQHSLSSPIELLQAPLIHNLSMDIHTGFPRWENWFKKLNIDSSFMHKNIQINNSAMVIQAARDGQGIALARSILVQDDIKSGDLIRLFPEINCHSSASYYLVYRSDRAQDYQIQKFRKWILDKVK